MALLNPQIRCERSRRWSASILSEFCGKTTATNREPRVPSALNARLCIRKQKGWESICSPDETTIQRETNRSGHIPAAHTYDPGSAGSGRAGQHELPCFYAQPEVKRLLLPSATTAARLFARGPGADRRCRIGALRPLALEEIAACQTDSRRKRAEAQSDRARHPSL